MLKQVEDFVDLVFKIHENGGTGYLLLWMVVAALGTALYAQLRANRKMQKAFIEDFTQRLDECEKKHAEQEKAHVVLKNKYTMLVGMLLVSLGKRSLPPDFWKIVLDDTIPTIPQIDFASKIGETA